MRELQELGCPSLCPHVMSLFSAPSVSAPSIPVEAARLCCATAVLAHSPTVGFLLSNISIASGVPEPALHHISAVPGWPCVPSNAVPWGCFRPEQLRLGSCWPLPLTHTGFSQKDRHCLSLAQHWLRVVQAAAGVLVWGQSLPSQHCVGRGELPCSTWVLEVGAGDRGAAPTLCARVCQPALHHEPCCASRSCQAPRPTPEKSQQPLGKQN